MSVLQQTLPNMLSGLLQEAMVQARTTPPQQVPQSTPIAEVAVGSVEPARVVDRVVATEEVSVQHMEVDHVDGATSPTTMYTDNAEANVSIRLS